jgi:creatinine amidohydrolase/Fe(II)-dependent formamide hydrolase-like protein
MSYPSIDYFRTITSPSWPSVLSSTTPLQLGHQLFRDHHGPQPSKLSDRLAQLRKRLSASRVFGQWKNDKSGKYEVLLDFDRLEERLHALVFEEEMWLKAQPAQPVGEVGMEVKTEKKWRGLELARSLSLERILTWRSE